MTKPIDADKLEAALLAYLPAEMVIKNTENKARTAEKDAEAAAVGLPAVLRPLQGQAWLDLGRGIGNSGSVDAYLPLLKIFYESLDDKADEIEGFYAHEDWQNYTIKVHALKSSARLIGALNFGEEAQLLENAGKAGDLAYIHAHHKAFIAEGRSFKDSLAEVFASAEAEKPEADPELMAAVLQEIRMAAERMDGGQLDSIFAEMEAYQVPQAQEAIWNQLVKAAGQYDYQKILSILA